MPGQMGNEITTIQNVEVVGVKADENLILIRGGIPGPKGALVVIRKAMKSYNKKKAA
jgi:large subunit ribosomal protein L3